MNVERIGKLRPCLVPLLVAWGALAPSPLGAVCTCTVQAAASSPTIQISGTSGGTCARRTSIAFAVDGSSVGSNSCDNTTSCSFSATASTICRRTGEHTVKATCSCGTGQPFCNPTPGGAETTFTVNTTPTVSVSYSGPDDLGQGTLSVPFSFPNTNSAFQRSLAVYVDGSPSGISHSPEEMAGTWTRPLSTACWRQGSHLIEVVAVACSSNSADFRAVASTTVVVSHQPDVSLSLSPVDSQSPTGSQVATVTYRFPQTGPTQRFLSLRAWPSGALLGTFSPTQQQGTWQKVVACSSGAQGVVAKGEACGDSFKQDWATLPGCPRPAREQGCGDSQCCLGPGGGSSPGGGGPGLKGRGLGPGADLYYLAGGAGSPGNPGQAVWSSALGRHWGHDYAERIIPDIGGRAWLIARNANFRKFTDAERDGFYETVSPRDEYRTLTKGPAGWTLRDLDGTVESFDLAGLWVSTTDRNGNAKTATYAAGRLAGVAMPDGRRETFSYHPSGKLAAITEIGVGGTESRTWTYVWSGEDLVSVERPDGTGLRFVYGDSRHPGYLTSRVLLGADDGDPATPRPERVEAAWAYDGVGNVLHTWSGSPDFSTGVDRYEFAYDDPFDPKKTTVTIHRGAGERDVVVYSISRVATGAKPRVTSVSGDCTSCGLSPSSQLFYDDPANPQLPTRTIDGRGNQTLLRYDVHGRVIERTEAAGTTLSRTTTWTYGEPAFPAFPTRIESPSTAGGAARRTTLLAYDAAGDLTSRREQGVEAGGFFDLETATTFHPSGRPQTTDPPGYGGEDVTSFSYDPSRGGLIPLTRIDPLVGTTAFDPFNRQTAVVDVNGVRTETAYDALDRILTVTQKDATPAEDLVTTHEYDAFGDLVRTALPRGNVIEYGHDEAGRLISIERKPDAATPSERTLYTLDLLGNRIKEELQRWDGAAWLTESWTDFVYVNRCQMGKTIHADGSATEYSFDCGGNLEKVWDANHPKATNPTPTQLYAYDPLDRLTSVTQPWTGSGGPTAVTRYTYDAQDHLTAVTDAEGNATTYTYGDRDLMTEEISPVSGTTTHAFNEHGELIQEIDARGIASARQVDALDRVTSIDWPDDALDTTYTYDDPAVPFSKGRLTQIARSGSEIDYGYDRFGRLMQDGELTYGYDVNGNRTEIGYPGGVTARFMHDFADRETSLEVQVGSAAPKTIVSAADYKPFGPLAGLTLGNGLTETRAFTNRYFPDRIEVPGRLTQVYTTDRTGNILGFDRTAGADHVLSTFTYLDPQYFLTQGTGPWGPQSWSYDRIGNRLSETLASESSLYSYLANPTGGHNPKLLRIEPAPGDEPGSRLDFAYDANGNQTTAAILNAEGPGRTSFLDPDAESHLSLLRTSDGPASTALLYDGRGFLRRSRLTFPNSADFEQTEPLYTSEGLLFSRHYQKHSTRSSGDGDEGGSPVVNLVDESTRLFYFAGHPVAQWTQRLGGGDTWLYLTTDHLGTAIQATDDAGAVVWEGGLDPFGTPFAFPRSGPPQEAGDQSTSGTTSTAMESAGIFLRFPGQWDDPSFRSHGLRGGLYYNVHRWYERVAGRYSQVDMQAPPDDAPYAYAASRPLMYVDPLGLRYCVASLYGRRTGMVGVMSHHLRSLFTRKPPPTDTAEDFNLIHFKLTCPCPKSIDVGSFSYNTSAGSPSAQFRWSWPVEPSTLYVDVSVGTRWVYTHDFGRLARSLQLCYDCK